MFLHLIDKSKLRIYLPFAFIFIITFFVYFISSSKNTPYNYYILLADAFINQRLYLLSNPSWLSELINFQGKYYVVFPPIPALMLTPFVLILGPQFSQTIFAIFIGSLNPVILYAILKKIKISSKTAFATTLFFAFGSGQWFLASTGSAWYLAHIVALFFLFLAILETFGKQRLFLIGLLLGASFWSRSTVIFSLPFFVFYMKNKFWPINKTSIYNLINLGLGIGFFIFSDTIYNFLRFHTFSPLSPYELIPNSNKPQAIKEGYLSFKHIPIHIDAMLLRLPYFRDSWPYVIPSLYSMAIWFVSLAIIYVFKAKVSRLMISSWLAVISTFFVISLWVATGYSEFGYRFAQDFMPFLLILLALGIGQKPKMFAYFLIALSMLINLWGIIMINYLNIWSM